MLVILQAEHLARAKKLPKLDELTGKAPRKKRLSKVEPLPESRPPMTKEQKAAAWVAEMAKMQELAPRENGDAR